ncbi:MAG: ABC transporter substrate-binding protein [Gemmatimonadetes bacterium]|jgi:phospholipid transport system substrate-binding protein|nr:ABC transporter substrate-binding protein [Gemmatimonadota bacterium]MBT6146820.1 ABC transporter substrate-binding protein [Gemmatimonadota bacterium]MBT7860770.1 ABC transporter substrate-binding protein [Gemmatimonadota bacterium]
MKNVMVYLALVACCLVSTARVGASERPAPTAFLRDLDTKVQAIVRAEGGDSLSTQENAHVRSLINQAFDFQELSRLSLGKHWSGRTAEEQTEFVAIYQGIIERRNFDIFVEYYRQGDISYVQEAIDDSGRARVEAQVPMKRETKQIVYALHSPEAGEQWRIYDLSIDGASTVDGNRRTYGRYITRHSFDKLMERLRAQLSQLQDSDSQ